MTWHSMKLRTVNREMGIRLPRNQTLGISFISLHRHIHSEIAVSTLFSAGTFKSLETNVLCIGHAF